MIVLGRILVGLGLLLASLGANAQTLLPNAQQTFTGTNGVPLAGGFVITYIPNTTSPKLTWQDSTGLVPNSNPIVLDSNGQARIWGLGTYRQIVLDSNSNLVWDQITTAPGSLAGTPCTTGHAVTWATDGAGLGCDPAATVVYNGLDVAMTNGALLSSVNPLYFPTYSQAAGTRLALALTGAVADGVGSFRDGLYVQVTDSDLTTYTSQHTNYAGRFAIFGPNTAGVWQAGDKNYVALNAYCKAANSGTGLPTFPPGCSGINADVVQYGAGIGDHEFAVTQPSAAGGTIAQSTSLASVQGIMDTNFADVDNGHTAYTFLASNIGTKVTTAAFGASGNGQQKALLQAGNVPVTEAAIVMPRSAVANEGSIIDYGRWNGNPVGGTFTEWVRATDGGTYAWVQGGNFLMSVGTSGFKLGNNSNLLNPAALPTNATAPFIAFTTMPGTPTGLPGIAGVGATACTYDTTAHKLWCYDQPAGAWKFAQFN